MTSASSEVIQNTFYDPSRADVAEAARLELMARYADHASLDALGRAVDRPGAVCVDVGAGDSTSLGQELRYKNPSIQYLPVDMRVPAVNAHWEAGFLAERGLATNLPFADSVADALHARFTFGWLDEVSRTRAFEEMLRVGKDRALLAVIDYDWSTARGPEPVNSLIGYVTKIMGAAGFDPFYGSHVVKEMQATLAEYGYRESTTPVIERRTIIQTDLERSLHTIEMTVLPVLNMLKTKDPQSYEELTELLEAVRRHAKDHPEDTVRFPDMVAATAILDNQERHEETLMRIHTARSLGAESMRTETMVRVGPDALNTYRLTNPAMVLQARRLHASAYLAHGHVTNEGIVADGPEKGTLVEEIDPRETIDASTYLGAVNREGVVTGCIRLIKPEEGNTYLLPTVVKIREALGDNSTLLRNLPFMDPQKKTKEASALGRSSQSDDPEILSKLLLATLCEAKASGDDYVVMGVVESTARLLISAYGSKAFKRIDGDAAVITLQGKGIKEGGVRLVPFYVDLNTFNDDCRAHFQAHPNEFAQKNDPLFAQTAAFMRNAA